MWKTINIFSSNCKPFLILTQYLAHLATSFPAPFTSELWQCFDDLLTLPKNVLISQSYKISVPHDTGKTSQHAFQVVSCSYQDSLFDPWYILSNLISILRVKSHQGCKYKVNPIKFHFNIWFFNKFWHLQLSFVLLLVDKRRGPSIRGCHFPKL